MRRLRTLLVALCLAAPLALPSTAAAQDWDVGPGPRRPARPTRPTRPARPTVPRPTRPTVSRPAATTPPTTPTTPTTPTPAANPNDRRARLIEHLLTTLVRAPEDASARLPVLLRLVRERDGNIDALVRDLEQRAAASPDDPGPQLLLGHVYRESGRLDDARARYEAAERVAPRSPVAPRVLGELHRRMDRAADALAAFERALERTARATAQADVLRALMALAVAAGDVPGARTYHTRLVALDRTGLSVRRELADALLGRGLHAEAAAEYQNLARALAGDNRVLPPLLRDLGRAQLGAGRADEALETFRRALRLAGADAGVRRELYEAMTEVHRQRNTLDAWVTELERVGGGGYEQAFQLGLLHADLGHTDAALAAFRRAAAARAGEVDARLRIIQLLASMGRTADEVTERRRLAALAPHHMDNIAELVRLLVQSGHRDEAMRMLAQASARAGSDAEAHGRLAQIYQANGAPELATHETQLVARLEPDDPVALRQLGDQYWEQNDRERALATWRRIRDGARDRARGAAELGAVYGDHDLLPQGIEAYREAVTLRPDEVDYHKGLATLLQRARQLDAAVLSWRRVIELSRNDRELRREARREVVNIWHLQGRLPAMAQAREREFAAAPPTEASLEAGRDLAEIYARLGRAEDAERTLRRVIAHDRADVASMLVLERVLTQRGDRAGAIEVLRLLVEADPRHAREWWQRMARHADALHRDEDAITFATRAVELNTDDAQGHLRLAELYRARNDMDHAVASFRRVIELNDRLFPAYFQLADLYLGRNEPRAALELYRAVIRLAADDELVGRAGRRAIQIAPEADAAGDLERDLSAASTAAPGRTVLRRLLVDHYAATCRPLINELRHGSPEAAARARATLTRLGARALRPMLDALGDADAAQQRVALEILGYLGNPNATTALVTVAEGSGAPELRRGALAAAAALGDARALPRLVALQRAEDPTLATLATWGVARVRTPAASAALVRALEGGHLADVSAMAALGLAGDRSAVARRALRAALAPGHEEVVQAAAAYALAGDGDPATLAALRAALGSRAALAGGGRRGRAAVFALATGPRGEDAAADAAAALFDGDASLRRVAARALARLAAPAAARAGAGGRAFDEPAWASSAGTMLDALLDPPGVPVDGRAAVARFAPQLAAAAQAALGGRDPAVVLDAMERRGALAPLVTGDAPDPEADAAVARITRELAPRLVALAASLAQAPAQESVDALVRRRALRRKALRVLAGTDAPEALPAFVHAAGDEDAATAETALRALAERPSPEATTAIARRLDEASPWTLRMAAAAALARAAGPEATARLAAALGGDGYAYVRVAAARALGARTDDPAARAALARAAAGDADAAVRAAAREALGGS